MAFGFLLMMMVGFSLWRLLGKTPLAKVTAAACPAAMLLIFWTNPPYYPKHDHGRRCMEYVQFLQPFAQSFKDGRRVLVPDHASELAVYLYRGDGPEQSTFTSVLPYEQYDGKDISKFLESNNVGHVFVDRPDLSVEFLTFVSRSPDWKLIALQKQSKRTLMLFARTTAGPKGQKNTNPFHLFDLPLR
jgi:hypothetical protein